MTASRSREHAFEETKRKFGDLDVLVNNAGVFRSRCVTLGGRPWAVFYFALLILFSTSSAPWA